MSTQHDTAARITGLLVFLAGIGLLAFVFISAHTLFNAPAPAAPPATGGAAGGGAPSAAVEIGRSFSQLGRQILVLLLMCIAGSVIASKGIQLYFAARPTAGTPATKDAASAVPPDTSASAANGQGAPPAPSAEPRPAPGPATKTNTP
jgi:hypothetical protein